MPTASLPSFPSVIKLHKGTHACPSQQLFEKVNSMFPNLLLHLALHKSLARTDYLFVIQYVPEDTIKSRWFLVQVNHHETEILKINSLRTEDYHVNFLSRHPFDKNLSDLSGTSIIWTIQIFLYMVLVYFLAQDGNQI